MDNSEFQLLITEKAAELYRDMPWRSDVRPYYILVSELMLQQTQVDRVIPKFNTFISAFPDEYALASASLSDVLELWNGLGYNRRAKYVHEAAKMVVSEYGGRMPDEYSELLKLPGVGPNTAGAIMTYAFNQPIVFIETNVRTVYFHHFFTDGDKVDDSELRVLVEQTIDKDNPREFYWALMDYGSWLKRQGAGKITQSRHYKKQSPLKGSIREVRGQIIRHLTTEVISEQDLRRALSADDRFEPALQGLIRDGLVTITNDRLHLTR